MLYFRSFAKGFQDGSFFFRVLYFTFGYLPPHLFFISRLSVIALARKYSTEINSIPLNIVIKFCVCFPIPCIIFALLVLHLLVVTQIRGHIAHSRLLSRPLPTTVLSREGFSTFFPRRLASNCAYPRYSGRSRQLMSFDNTSWFKLNDGNLFPGQSPRGLFRVRPWNFAQVSYEPLPRPDPTFVRFCMIVRQLRLFGKFVPLKTQIY